MVVRGRRNTLSVVRDVSSLDSFVGLKNLLGCMVERAATPHIKEVNELSRDAHVVWANCSLKINET